MCTVTFIPVGDRLFITSNRDEKLSRKQAIRPAVYYHQGSKLLFPKDADAGGTWIAVNANGNVAVLLNGAFQKHDHSAAYTKSRGLILLDTIAATGPVGYFEKTDLHNVEPFTLIIREDSSLFECRWDAAFKHVKQLSSTSPHIWSSVTLYDTEMMKRREHWFAEFLYKTPRPGKDEIFTFHSSAGDGNHENDLRMNRHGLYATVSITCIDLNDHSGAMFYHDCKAESDHQRRIQFISSYIEPCQ